MLHRLAGMLTPELEIEGDGSVLRFQFAEYTYCPACEKLQALTVYDEVWEADGEGGWALLSRQDQEESE